LKISEHKVVAALGEAIAQRIGEPRYDFWFLNKTKFTWQGEHLVVGVPNMFYQEWLQNTFADPVAAAAKTVYGRNVPVKFAIDPQLFQAARQSQSKAEPTRSSPQERRPGSQGPDHSAMARHDPQPSLGRPSKPARRWRRLEDFVVGACNRVAHASALSVVEAPGQGVNPLVLHGPVGTGKTHLLEGICAGLRQRRSDWRVFYVTAEEFTNRFVQALRSGKLGSFRKHFRECDVLILDDLHFLARKRATREEYLHTFDVLLANDRQLVISCDCHPRLADDFSPELTDRLLSGPVWGLAPPDVETRLAILRTKAGHSTPLLSEEVLRHLAEQLRGNVRELEGALHGVLHYARVTGMPIDVPAARAALADLLRHAIRVVALPDLDRAVCQVLRLEPGTLQAKNRAWAVSHPRMLAIYLARKHTAAAYSEIGRYFGGRNHTTAVAAERKVRSWLEADCQLRVGAMHLPFRQVVELVERELFR
jgi:chromosomal replication initiator protein